MSLPKLKNKPISLPEIAEQQQALITISHLFAQALTDLSLYGKLHFKVSDDGSVEYCPQSVIIKQKEEEEAKKAFSFDGKKDKDLLPPGHA